MFWHKQARLPLPAAPIAGACCVMAASARGSGGAAVASLIIFILVKSADASAN